LTGIFLYAMYKVETIAVLITDQSLVYPSNPLCWPRWLRFRQNCFTDDQIGSGVGVVNLGGQSAGFVAPAGDRFDRDGNQIVRCGLRLSGGDDREVGGRRRNH
jgi:hypothetical protein